MLTACGGAALTVLALRSCAPGLRRSLWVLLVAAVVFLVFHGLAQQTPSVPMSTVQQATHYVRGRVVEVTDNAYQGQQDYEDIPVGKQTVRAELRSGKYRGQVYELPNQLSYLYGTILKAGDAVTVAVTEEDGEISSMTLQDYDRTVPLALVVLAFLVVTVLVGRRVGAKSLLGLGLTVVCIFSILIPLLLGGWPTLPTILGMCAYVTVVEFVILGGVNRKTLCAILGTISGVAFAALFGELACALLRVNGYKMYSAEPTIEALLQIKQGQDPMHSLQLGDLLVGGIVIAALGAVNDVAMSISSAMNELVAVNPAAHAPPAPALRHEHRPRYGRHDDQYAHPCPRRQFARADDLSLFARAVVLPAHERHVLLRGDGAGHRQLRRRYPRRAPGPPSSAHSCLQSIKSKTQGSGKWKLETGKRKVLQGRRRGAACRSRLRTSSPYRPPLKW